MHIKNPYWILGIVLFSCMDSKETKLQRFLIQSNDLVKKQNVERAEHFLTEALKLDSCFADAWNNLGTLYFNQMKYAEALEYYDNAVRCRPDFTVGYFNRANTAYELKEYYRALKDLDIVIKNKPDTSTVYFLQGLINTRLRKFNEALSSFRKAQSLDQRNSEILVNLGTVYYYK